MVSLHNIASADAPDTGFEKVCGKKAGGYIHWGATTQDIMDTAVVLQIKDAHRILTSQVKELLGLCLKRAKENQNLVMAGRTHGQHAVPLHWDIK